MRFKLLVDFLFLASLGSASLDIAITELGYLYFPPELEANQYINNLSVWFPYPIAAGIVFLVTTVFIILPYRFLLQIASEPPYSGTLRDVGAYLWNSGRFNGRDALLFASLVLYGIFIHLHLTGFLSWLRFFILA